ncbi:MAG TPA: zf-HC2 domain-containing protein [Candidatus Methylomirabilis sp.]|nr:zf-HC2 domain-containing protein [Candidatus Methylomirabilis sp.]
MTTDAFARYLQAYCDGELEVSKMLEVEGHLETCPSCRQTVEAERAFREGLREKILVEPVPLHLQERIRSAMAELEESDRRPTLQPAFRPRTWLMAASVLLLAFGGVLGYLIAGRTSRFMPSPVLAQLVGEHVRSTQLERSVELRSGNTQEVAFWLQGRIEHPILVPDYNRMGIELLGGRVLQLGDRRVASVVYEYRKGGKILSLFALPGTGYKGLLIALEEARKQGQVFLAFESEGQQMLLWGQGEMVYALVSDVGWDDLFECARVFFDGESSSS